MSQILRYALIPAYLLLCLLLGGASAAGYWANLALQLLALPIIGWALLVRRNTPMATPARQLMAITLLMLLVIILQLLPLPPGIWTALPGREKIAEGFVLLGQPLPWLPISLSPRATLSSALWLLPSIAVLLGIVRIGGFKPSWIGWSVAFAAALSVPLGLVQVVSNGDPGWYFYEITNFGAATGFFSNTKHLATLLLAAIPLLAALYIRTRGTARSARVAVLAIFLAAVIAGIAVNGSAVAIAFFVPVAAATFLMLKYRHRKLPSWTFPVVAVLALSSIAAVFIFPLDNSVSQETQEAPDYRYSALLTSSEAAADHFPFGSGLGTFVNIYPMYEDPADVTRFYVNHVHNDYVELALETGLPGLLVLVLFLLWWVRRAAAVWRAETPDHFARAATMASAVVLAQSLVDYPLRTAAIGALFAACCALMSEPRPAKRRSGKKPNEAEQARHLSAD